MIEDDGKQTARALAAHNRWLGRTGEELAANFLVAHGFRLLHRNWCTFDNLEIDIVAMRNGCLHIVEVKTRQYEFVYTPMSAITLEKLEKLNRAAYLYKSYFGIAAGYVIDGIGIVFRSESDYDLKFVPGLHRRLIDRATDGQLHRF